MPEPSRRRASISLVAIIFAFLAGVVAGPVAYSVGIVLMMRSVVDYALEGRQVKHPAQAESNAADAKDTNAGATRPDAAASVRSVSACMASLKQALSGRGISMSPVLCRLRTVSGITIEVAVYYSPFPNDNELKQSDMRSYLVMNLPHYEPWHETTGSRIVIDRLPTKRVYRLLNQYLNEDGSEKALLDVEGAMRSYAVMGAKKMYWVRCNVGSDDYCVVFIDVFGRKSPDGQSSAPGGEPWPPQQDPCFILTRFRFHDTPGGTQLAETIDIIEEFSNQIVSDRDLQLIFDQYCTYRATPKG